MELFPTPLGTAGGAIHHGGDLGWAERTFGPGKRPWIDLSTGVNPWPYPFTHPEPSIWTRLPGSDELQRLCEAAAAAYGAPGPECVAPVPGSQALIQWLPRLRGTGRVAVLGPTYAEHAACWAAGGHTVQEVEQPEQLPGDRDVVVVVNPNNPDGRVLAPERLLPWSRSLAARGGWLIVDEAFADLTPEVGLAKAVSTPGLLVLRSFGKFYGLPGARLGFLLGAPDLAERIRRAFGPWAVGGAPCAAGVEALRDARWRAHTRRRIQRAAAELDGVLSGYGLKVIGGTGLFRLVASKRAGALFRALGSHGVLVRHFPEHREWLRFGLPANPAAVERLRGGLEAWRRTP